MALIGKVITRRYHDAMKAFWKKVHGLAEDLRYLSYNKMLEHDGYFERWN